MGKNYYKILHLKESATEDDIKKAYRKLALRLHPDKNSSPEADEKFKEVAEAYDILIDKKKRKVYDLYGEEGLKGDANQESNRKYSYTFRTDPKSTFSQFFGSSSSFQKFFDFGFSDGSRLFTYQNESMVIEDPFKSFGSYDMRHGGLRSPTFKLHESTSKEKQNYQNSVEEHDVFVSLEEILTGCVKKVKVYRTVLLLNGSSAKEEKVFTINIPPGLKVGTKIAFQNESDKGKYKYASDIVFVIRDKPHPVFKREGCNLKYVAIISLKKALCGCEIEVPTLKGEKVKLNLINEILQPQTQKKLTGLGLPLSKDGSKKGDLIVSFDIRFPNSLPMYVKNILGEALPDRV